MRRLLVIIIISAVIINIAPASCYSSDYEGRDKEESIFQKLGDLITGRYEVKGEPISKKGVIQAMADEVKDIESAPVK